MVHVHGLYSEDADAVYSLQQPEPGVCVEGLGVCTVQCWTRSFSAERWLRLLQSNLFLQEIGIATLFVYLFVEGFSKVIQFAADVAENDLYWPSFD